MPLNTGVTSQSVTAGDGSVITASVFYNPVLTGGLVDPTQQPIRNNANGFALLITNTGTKAAIIKVTGPSGPFLGDDGTQNVKIPAAGLTRTAAFLRNQFGINTRADVTNFELDSPADDALKTAARAVELPHE